MQAEGICLLNMHAHLKLTYMYMNMQPLVEHFESYMY